MVEYILGTKRRTMEKEYAMSDIHALHHCQSGDRIHFFPQLCLLYLLNSGRQLMWTSVRQVKMSQELISEQRNHTAYMYSSTRHCLDQWQLQHLLPLQVQQVQVAAIVEGHCLCCLYPRFHWDHIHLACQYAHISQEVANHRCLFRGVDYKPFLHRQDSKIST